MKHTVPKRSGVDMSVIPMEEEVREWLIEELVQHDTETCGSQEDGWEEYIANIVRSGFKGYENFTDEELALECDERGIDGDDLLDWMDLQTEEWHIQNGLSYREGWRYASELPFERVLTTDMAEEEDDTPHEFNTEGKFTVEK